MSFCFLILNFLFHLEFLKIFFSCLVNHVVYSITKKINLCSLLITFMA
jgi:hypothetical protein